MRRRSRRCSKKTSSAQLTLGNTGGSTVRDSQRDMENGEPGLFIDSQGGNDDTPVYLLGNSAWLKIERGMLPYPVEFDEDEKSIKLSGF